MTAIVFALQPDQICIAMDTLVVGADDKLPQYFHRKFIALPQANIVVAGTGLMNLITSWFSFLSSFSEKTNIDQINNLVPHALRELSRHCYGTDLITTTLYHFGYSNQEERYLGYAYRSTKNFDSDRLQYALGFKPVVSVTPTHDIRFPDFLIDMVIEQQRQDQLLPTSQKVGIGGEIEFVYMVNQRIQVETVYRFASYNDEENYIKQRHNEWFDDGRGDSQ